MHTCQKNGKFKGDDQFPRAALFSRGLYNTQCSRIWALFEVSMALEETSLSSVAL